MHDRKRERGEGERRNANNTCVPSLSIKFITPCRDATAWMRHSTFLESGYSLYDAAGQLGPSPADKTISGIATVIALVYGRH